jgi:uncharacterized protein YfaS (alpha-2-macroglobulin family)
MRTNYGTASLVTSTLLVAGYLMSPTATKAAELRDSEQITQLLADAKAEAVELKSDASDMESFTKSKLSWQTYAGKAEMIKEHVNQTGKLVARLKEAEAYGSPWQQAAIQRIEPLLQELAANTEATINHLNENRSKIHFAPFKDYVRVNYELATDLEALIRDFVNYGEAKRKFERLGDKLEVTS